MPDRFAFSFFISAATNFQVLESAGLPVMMPGFLNRTSTSICHFLLEKHPTLKVYSSITHRQNSGNWERIYKHKSARNESSISARICTLTLVCQHYPSVQFVEVHDGDGEITGGAKPGALSWHKKHVYYQ